MGPYQTEAEAGVDIRDVYNPPHTTGDWQRALERKLVDVCGGAGVELGAYDRRILCWLAGWEPASVQAVCGMLVRAYRSGQRSRGNVAGSPGVSPPPAPQAS